MEFKQSRQRDSGVSSPQGRVGHEGMRSVGILKLTSQCGQDRLWQVELMDAQTEMMQC